MGGKLIFLGTGGDAITVGKQYLASGGLILQYEGTQFHIDPGPGSLPLAAKYGVNLRENTAILVSHNHLNHASDVNASISAMTHGGLDKRGVLLCNKTVLSGTDELKSLLNPYYGDMVERAIAVEPGQRIGINEIEIKVAKAIHHDPHAVGFKITVGKTTIGIPCDTGIHEDIVRAFEHVDLLILNVQNPGEKLAHGMLCSQEAAELVKQIQPKQCIITHFGVKMMDADPQEEARYINRESKVQTIAAKDGYTIELDEIIRSSK